MYVHVTAKGTMSFRMDYRLNWRRGTIYLGKCGPEGLSLARAREKCIGARRNIAARYSHYPGRRRPDAGCLLRSIDFDRLNDADGRGADTKTIAY